MSGVEIFLPLAKLKKFLRNVRKMPHGEAAIEVLTASIQHSSSVSQEEVPIKSPCGL